MDSEEKKLADLHGLDIEQIAWRRAKISQLGSSSTSPKNYREFFRAKPSSPRPSIASFRPAWSLLLARRKSNPTARSLLALTPPAWVPTEPLSPGAEAGASPRLRIPGEASTRWRLSVEACREAGVPGSAHGVRKLAATTMANNGATVPQLEAVFGWTGGRMASWYTRSSDRRRLAKSSVHMLVNDERTNHPAPNGHVRALGQKNAAMTRRYF